MARINERHGGRRPGSGRKSKAEELGLVALLNECATEADRKACIRQLAKDCKSKDFHERHESRKLLLSYIYGKPTEKHEHANPDGSPLLQPVAEAMVKVYGSSNSDSK